MSNFINIRKTTGEIILELENETLDLETLSLVLTGRNAINYGQSINENFVKLLENFASGVEPLNPMAGQLWYDTENKHIKYYSTQENWVSLDGFLANIDQPNRLAGAVGYNHELPFNDTSLVLFLAEGKIVAAISPIDIPYNDLQRTVIINEYIYNLRSRFEDGLKKGMNLSTADIFNYEGGHKWGPMRRLTFINDLDGELLIDGSRDYFVNVALIDVVDEIGEFTKVIIDHQGRVREGDMMNFDDIVAALGYVPVNQEGDEVFGNLIVDNTPSDETELVIRHDDDNPAIIKLDSAGSRELEYRTGSKRYWRLRTTPNDDENPTSFRLEYTGNSAENYNTNTLIEANRIEGEDNRVKFSLGNHFSDTMINGERISITSESNITVDADNFFGSVIATRQEALHGISNSKLMTPLRVEERIAALIQKLCQGGIAALGCDDCGLDPEFKYFSMDFDNFVNLNSSNVRTANVSLLGGTYLLSFNFETEDEDVSIRLNTIMNSNSVITFGEETEANSVILPNENFQRLMSVPPESEITVSLELLGNVGDLASATYTFDRRSPT